MAMRPWEAVCRISQGKGFSPEKEVSVMQKQQEWLAAAIEAAQIGGAVLRDWMGRFSVREKSRKNLVTEADEASQAAIVESLRAKFPDHGFLGEENLNERTAGTECFWIIDPLDGTTNYVHGFPYFAVSIALSVQGQLQVGVIHDPLRQETFSAIRGVGAWRNDVRIETSGERDPGQAFGMASLPVATDRENPAVQRFLKSLAHLQTVQRSGSAALNLAFLACGRIDAFWSSSLSAWDVAAGALILEEAGGSITSLTGDTFDIFVPSLLAASTSELREKLLNVLS